MSSAIEVLKTMREVRMKPTHYLSKYVFEDRTIAEAKAIGEALLALEQKLDWDSLQDEMDRLKLREIQLMEIINSYQTKQRNLKEWLEKEIKVYEEADPMTVNWEEGRTDDIRNKTLKEILKWVGEQK